jgi:hypothetical protein
VSKARCFSLAWFVWCLAWTVYVMVAPVPRWELVACGFATGASGTVLAVRWALEK